MVIGIVGLARPAKPGEEFMSEPEHFATVEYAEFKSSAGVLCIDGAITSVGPAFDRFSDKEPKPVPYEGRLSSSTGEAAPLPDHQHFENQL